MEASDERLAIAAAAGDRGAFSTLLERHYDRVFALAFRLSGRQADAEDLTQDICAALPAKLGSFRSDARFTTWLYRVVVNAAHDRRRRLATYQKATEGWGDWEMNQRASAEEGAERTSWLMQAMGALGHDLRDTLALILDDLTHAEAAEVLEVSEGTISWRMSEIKKQLAQLRAAEEQV
ncbi:MAG: RNA polymerase sigma factor [Arenibacterium sp.]